MRLESSRINRLLKISIISVIIVSAFMLVFSVDVSADILNSNGFEDKAFGDPYNSGSINWYVDRNASAEEGTEAPMIGCLRYDNFDSTRVWWSLDQGASMNGYREHFNGTDKDAGNCLPSVSPSGDTLVYLYSINRDAGRILEMYVSTDQGITWQKQSINETKFGNDLGQHNLDVVAANNGTINIMSSRNYEYSEPFEIMHYYSQDGGDTWENTTISDTAQSGGYSDGSVGYDCWGRNHCAALVAEDNSNIDRSRFCVYFTESGGDSWSRNNCFWGSSTNYAENAELYLHSSTHLWFFGYEDYSNYGSFYWSNNQGNSKTNELTTGDCSSTKFWGQRKNFSYQGVNCKNTHDIINKGSGFVGNHPTEAGNVNSFYPDLWLNVGFNSNGQPTLYREKAPAPAVSRQASHFGDAVGLGQTWNSGGPIYVRDINSDTKGYRVSTIDLSITSEDKICQKTFDEDDSFWEIGPFNKEWSLQDANSIQGLAVTRDFSNHTVWSCGAEDPDGNNVGGMVAGTTTWGINDAFYDGIPEPAVPVDAVYNDQFAYGITSPTDHWGIVTSSDTRLESANDELPVHQPLTDVAVEKDWEITSPYFCESGQNSGTVCVNQNGGIVANETKDGVKGNEIQVYQENLFVWNGSHVNRYKIDVNDKDFDLIASTVVSPTQDLQIGKDGKYLVGLQSSNLTVYNSTTLDVVTNSTTITDSETLQYGILAPNNDVAWVISKTTLFEVPLFNHTTSEGDDGNIIGKENTATNYDTSTEDSTSDEGGETVVEGQDPFPAPEIGGMTSSESGIVMTILAILIFGVGLYSVTGNGTLAGVGSMMGFFFAVANSWVPTWFVILTALIATSIIVLGFGQWVGNNERINSNNMLGGSDEG